MSEQAGEAGGARPAKVPHVTALLDNPDLAKKYADWTEPWDALVPRGGWLEDFVTSTKGIEAPSSLCTWTGFGVLNAALQRESYLDRFPSPLFPNLYVILVAKPGLAKKSTILNYGASILRKFANFIPIVETRILKEIKIHSDSITPEGLQKLLKPTTVVENDNGNRIEVAKGSRIALFVSELAVFLGAQNYKLGLIQKLTDFYDGRDIAADYTKSEGYIALEDVFVSLTAATTPDDIVSAIPREAFGGGLMSRTIVIYEDEVHRIHEDPFAIAEAATPTELAKKLAWIAVKGAGAYTRSEACQDYYSKWYRKQKHLLASTPEDILSISRMDTHINKVALLIRAQRYEEGRQIELGDFQLAERLLENAYERNKAAVWNIGSSEYGKKHAKVEEVVKRKGTVLRRDLVSWMSRYANVTELNEILAALIEAGLIRVKDQHGDWKTSPSRDSMESYVWWNQGKHR